MSSTPSTSSKTLYRTLLIESDDVSEESLAPELVKARFMVERCTTPAEAVNLFNDHDLVLIRAHNGVKPDNLRHLVSWLRHNSVEGAEPFAMLVAGKNVLDQLDGLSCDMIDESAVGSKLPAHLEEVRGYLDATRKQGDSSFWSRLFGRSQSLQDKTDTKEPAQDEAEPDDKGAAEKIVETKTGQHMNSPKLKEDKRKSGQDKPKGKEEEIPERKENSKGRDSSESKAPVAPLVPREKAAGFKGAPREVAPFRRPIGVSALTPVLFNEISEAAALLDQDFRVVEVNDAWLKLFGVEKGRLVGSTAVELQTGFDKDAWTNILHRALVGREFDADPDVLNEPIQSLRVRPVLGDDSTPKGVLILCKSFPVGDSGSTESAEPKTRGEPSGQGRKEPEGKLNKVSLNEISEELVALREKIKAAEEEKKSALDDLEKQRIMAKAAQTRYELQRKRFDELVEALSNARSAAGKPDPKAASLLEKVGTTKIELSLLDYAPFGILRLSSDGEVMFANTQLNELMGYSITPGESFTDWIAMGRPSDETSAALVVEWTDKVWRRQTSCVVQIAGDDGLLKDVEFRPTLMEDGGLLVFVSDVTDRQQVYTALRSAEMKLRGVFRSPVAGVAMMNAAGSIYDANATFCEMFAQKRSEICAATLSDLLQGCGVDEAPKNTLENPLRISLPKGGQAMIACPDLESGDDALAIFCIPVSNEDDAGKTTEEGNAREVVDMMSGLAEEWRKSLDGKGGKSRPEVLARWFDVFSSVITPDGRDEVDIASVVRHMTSEVADRMEKQAREKVLFDMPVDERLVPRATAVPLVLAISELIDNAIVHGLKNGGKEGLVRVHFTCSEQEIITEICNTGAGLRTNFEFEKHAGEGLRLARLLVERLGGKLSLVPGTETRCQIDIPIR